MANANEIELNRLNKLIADLQWNIFQGGGFQAATTSILVQSLGEAERRLARAEHAEIITREEEGRKQQQDLAVAIVLAERETMLSQAERQEFGSFLNCEFFKRSDFDRLEHFYINTWDRLTEEGKAEMSYRIWEGVRREEYRFTELPDVVKEKEAQQLRHSLGLANAMQGDLKQILAQDRADFIQAWDGGNRQEAYKVLDRPSFSEHVSRSPAVVEAIGKREADKQEAKVATAKTERTNGAETARSSGTLDFKDFDSEAHRPSAPLAGRLPNSSNGRGN